MIKNWYAVYKGDTFLCQGTKEECARYLDVKPNTIYFMSTPTYKRRRKNSINYLIVIKVEEGDE